MKKIAIIFGNNDYCSEQDKLNCAVKDAEDMSVKLKRLGFDTLCYTNKNLIDMGIHLADFENKLNDYEVGLFYFAGHGFEINSVNYLATIDTGMQDEATIRNTSYKLEEIIEILKNSSLNVKIIILDACRGIGSGVTRGKISTSFAPVFAPAGTIIAFSTSPGQSAKEMEDRSNGYYTKALIDHIESPGTPIENMFKRVRETLSARTRGQQISWEHTSLLGDFYFNPLDLKGEYSVIYSSTVLADDSYTLANNGYLTEIIQNLKTHDYNYQNPTMLTLRKMDLSRANKEELFILGRNIYQAACGPSFSAQAYLSDFEEVSKINDDEVNFHVVNGMAYEIYFNGKNKLRNIFKSERYEIILKLLEQNKRFEKSLSFIQNQLSQYSDCIIYIPGTYQEYILNIELKKNDDGIFDVEQIYCKGKPVLYDYTGKTEYNLDGIYNVEMEKKSFEKAINFAIVAPKGMLGFIYNIEGLEESSGIGFPYEYSLRWNAK